MKIVRNSVVTIDYTLKDEKGNVLDTSSHNGPLSFIQGVGNIIPGLETALEGKTKGEQLKATIEPEDAYGDYRKDLVQTVPKDQFETSEEVVVGMQVEANTEGGPMVFSVVEVGQDVIKLDGNHPLAGIKLFFDVSILEVREASEEEIVHGHVHGPHGHHHH